MEIPNGSISFGVEKEFKMVTSETYFAYVLDNFFSIFNHKIPKSTIGYDNGNEPVIIKNHANNFFESKQIIHKESVVWKEWKGELVPFIFGDPNLPLFTKTENQTIINADMIASSFYFLSGWQEITDKRRDSAGRFLYDYSIQKELDIAHLPVVNIYFDILKTALEERLNINLVSKFEKPVICISHDIDEWAKLWRQKAKKAMKSGDLLSLINTLWNRITKNHLPESFLPLFDLQQKFNFRSSFYILTETKKSGNYNNGDYDIIDKSIVNFINKTQNAGNEIGLHGSFFVHQNKNKLKNELDLLPTKPIGYRSHFLVFEMDETPYQLENAGFRYDTTLGFPNQIGWRNSCSYPFYLFDHQNQRTSEILEIPLVIMDGTLFFEKYLRLDAASALKKCLEFVQIVEKHGGIMNLLWHNNAFIPYLNPGWAIVLENVLIEAKKKGIQMLKGEDVLSRMNADG